MSSPVSNKASSTDSADQTKGLFPPAERRTRTDFAILAALVVLTLVVIAGAWFTSQQREVDHSLSDQSSAGELLADSKSTGSLGLDPSRLPGQLAEKWHSTSDSSDFIAVRGGIVRTDGQTLSMLNAETGEEVWHYSQQRPICSVSQPERWDTVVATFRGPKGCGEAISFDVATGQYAYTRDALASDSVETLQGNNRAGTISPQRVEIWRSDLVRTVEVGYQEAPHQPGQQEHLECNFTSALTADDILVTAQHCPDQSKKLIRFLKATPESSDEPESIHEFTVPSGAELVATSGDEAAIYIPPNNAEPARIQILEKSGQFHNQAAPVAPAYVEGGEVGVEQKTHQPRIHTESSVQSWFDGQRLTIFNLADLQKIARVEGAKGTGAMFGGSMLVPVQEGIAVVNPTNGQVTHTITVDRGGYAGDVDLRVSGGKIVEKRGEEIVGLG